MEDCLLSQQNHCSRDLVLPPLLLYYIMHLIPNLIINGITIPSFVIFLVLGLESSSLNTLWSDKTSTTSSLNAFVTSLLTYPCEKLDTTIFVMCIAPHLKDTLSPTLEAIKIIANSVVKKFLTWVNERRIGSLEEKEVTVR